MKITEGRLSKGVVKGMMQPFLEFNGEYWHVMNMSTTHIAAVKRTQPRQIAVFTFNTVGKDEGEIIVNLKTVSKETYTVKTWGGEFKRASILCGFEVPARRNRSMLPDFMQETKPSQESLRFPEKKQYTKPELQELGKTSPGIIESYQERFNRLFTVKEGKLTQQSEMLEVMLLVMELTRISEPAMLDKLITSYRRKLSGGN